MTNLEKSALRQQLRSQRRNLDEYQQQRASKALDRCLRRHPAFRRAAHLAFYLPNDGEISPLIAMKRLTRQGHACYLPCLAGKSLVFRRYRPGEKLVTNRFGIPEPSHRRGNTLSAKQLNIIFLPLVGFDAAGNRLGMGGGFYDRTLSQLPPRNRPLLVGLAHELQRVDKLPVQRWDIPLDAVVTDHRIYWLKGWRP